MSTLSCSFVSIKSPPTLFMPSGSSLKSTEPCLVSFSPSNLCNKAKLSYKKPLTVRASGDYGSSSAAGAFIGGFVLGGIVVGALGCVYAPQLSKALTGDDRKELLRKLPKFIYDEEKALEKTRKVLTEKIERLNSAIDELSGQPAIDAQKKRRSAAASN